MLSAVFTNGLNVMVFFRRPVEVELAQGKAVVLLAGRPGHLRNALQSLLHTMPGLKFVATADTGLLALKTIREIRPDLVLVGSGWPDAEVLELVRQFKQEWPATGCLVLTEKSQQYHRVMAAGADSVLSSGLPIGQIFSTIKQMLADTPHRGSGLVSADVMPL